MGKLQFSRDLADSYASHLIAFLQSLAREVPAQFAAAPAAACKY